MTIRRELAVVDGRPTWHYISDGHVVYSGPITGHVDTADGTRYDVSDDWFEVHPDHVGEVAHLVGVRHEDEGHPSHAPTLLDPHPEPFLHLCTPHCGDAARDLTHLTQVMALAAAQEKTNAIADGDVRDHFAQAMGTVAGGGSMALASVAAENAALNGLDGTGSTNVIPDVSLHTATPGTTGASETANTGSYARQANTNNAAASGSKTNSTSLTFSTLGTIPVTHFGTWSSATYAAGTYAIGGALTASVTAASITIAAGGITLSAS